MHTTRRNSLKLIAAGTTSIFLPSALQAKVAKLPKAVAFGLIADPHIGFVDDAPTRLEAFLETMKSVKPDALIQLGDFATPDAKQQPHIDKFNQAQEHTLHVMGNHDLDHRKTREDVLKSWGMPATYYTQEISGIKIIVLDGNEKGSPTHHTHGGYPSYIGPKQQTWLKKELSDATTPVLIVSHQPLAGDGAVDNAKEMQSILSSHKDKILLAINGHSHLDSHHEIDDIHYLHINSASYFWLGGKVRLAKYKDPLFTTLRINPTKGTITLDAKKSTWLKDIKNVDDLLTKNKQNLKGRVHPSISAQHLTNIKAL
ncbi:metallophosphoesterase family protein [Rubritalea tangerina]|uniref:Metallophosphoesterase family protein n=1 Tax=Rubritalea tangerina TaxID=430798 RepID=A0ABW4Z9A0_9BACT